MKGSYLILLSFVLFGATSANSVLSRFFSREDGQPMVRNPLEDDRVSSADVGMKSNLFIGTFGGRPIVTRQENTFIDQDGVPVPMLPYYKADHKSHHLLNHKRFMERSRETLSV